MLLDRAASLFQSQGFTVKVRPCVIGNSGAIHTPDLVLTRDAEKARAVFVLDALDGHMPLEQRRGMAQDMGYDPVFVIGRPSDEVQRWAERHKVGFIAGEELGEPEAPAAPPPPKPVIGDTDAEILAVSPRRGASERPLTAFQHAQPAAPMPRPLDPLPHAPRPEDGAMLLPGNPRADAPPPRPPRQGRGAVQFPTEVPDDGDAVLLTSEPKPPKREAMPPAQPAQATRWEAAVAEEGGTGAELLPSAPAASAAHGADEADRVAKHDLSIWNPTARLQAVKQAAKARGFETTAPQAPPGYQSEWLNKLKK